MCVRVCVCVCVCVYVCVCVCVCVCGGGCLLRLFGIIVFHTVNIISLTSVGRAFENMENKIQIKSFRRSYRANAKR